MQTSDRSVMAVAHPNIAFIKYWGNLDDRLRIPVNGSLSMNLSGLETRTTVQFDEGLSQDSLVLNEKSVSGGGLARVTQLLDRVRKMAGLSSYARVVSENNFPTGTGIASSASAYAALAVAAAAAARLDLPESELSRLARTGSGSASRSVPGGFVEWQAGQTHEESFAFSIAPIDHWDLVDCVAIVSKEHKPTGSTQGHALAPTSPLQAARVADAPRRIAICRQAVWDRDFAAFADIVELDSNMMHAVMQTSAPRLQYWAPATMAVMAAVAAWRSDEGIKACFTIDAGPNVHVLCMGDDAGIVEEKLRDMPGVLDVRVARPGGSARRVENQEG